jgi:sec-independent protein translocase protein TatA
MTFGIFELAVLVFIVFLLLGPKRIQNLLAALGRGVRDFTTEFGGDKEQKELPEQKPERETRRK